MSSIPTGLLQEKWELPWLPFWALFWGSVVNETVKISRLFNIRGRGWKLAIGVHEALL